MALCCMLSCFGPLVVMFLVAVVLLWAFQKFIMPSDHAGSKEISDLRGLHVLVTGGSKGIGRSLAVEAVRQGASVVTIVARDRTNLDDARLELTQLAASSSQPQLIQAISLDLTTAFDTVAKAIEEAEKTADKPINVLINNAGGSVDGEFENLPIDSFEKQMRLNYISAVYATRAVVKSMKSRSAEYNRIVFVSSQAGQVGVYGYSAYSPAKYALRGLAEVLRMEYRPYNIGVTIAFPPNTRTEGFMEELQHMPEATRLISGDGEDGIMDASTVAHQIWKDVRAGRYQSTMKTDGWMLGILSAGMTPVQNGSYLDLLQQVALSGLLRLVALFYVNKFDRIVAKCEQRKIDTAEIAGESKRD